MASSDEEDLEALRNAALASLRQKQAAQEPQGIQVVSRVAIQTPNQYHQQVPEPISHPDGNFDYSEYGEVPFAFQQAVLSRQARGRGRGFHRGRGRGRGNRFPPKPEPQSALIVIQPSGGQEEQAKVEGTSKDSRPFLLRPQDKWASTESGSQSSTPTRPKETSKFSRYEEATDSEDDDDLVERNRRESVGVKMDMSLDDVSSDTEMEGNANHNNEVEVHDHFNEVEVHNSEQDINDCVEMNEKDAGITDGENAIDMSQNIAIDEVQSDLNTPQTVANTPQTVANTPQTVAKSDMDIPSANTRKEENDIGKTIPNDLKYSESANADINEENSFLNENIGTHLNTGEGSDSTPLRDEPTPVQDELRQDDSVSNSYIAFSRFNRRNREDSDSAEESAESAEDIDPKSVSNSRNSSISRESSRSQSESDNDVADNEIDANNIEAVPDTKTKESPHPHVTHSKTNQSSQESRASVTSLKSSKSSKSSSSSSSDSDSDSSSSSSSSSSDSDSSSETSKNHKQKSVSKAKTKVKTGRRKSESPDIRDIKSRSQSERKSSNNNELNARNIKRSPKRKDEKEMDFRKRSTEYSRRESKRDLKSPIRKSGKESSFNKKSVKDRLSSGLSLDEVKADPEFDATNYRDETMYQRNDRGRHGTGRLDYDRKQDRENQIGKSKSNSKSRNDYGKDDKGKYKGEREKPDEKRHFEAIGRLKNEETKTSRDLIGKRGIETSSSYKHRKRSRSKSAESTHDRRKAFQATELNKKERNARSSKSDSHLISAKAVKAQSDHKEFSKHKEKESKKSDERLKRKSTDDKEKSKQKNTKDVQKTKRRSIEEKLQKLASQAVKSDPDSDSDKSVSSLSDLSSDSETETWRDKKHGASRKTADIELEKRRRLLKEREMEREKRKSEKTKFERGDGDKDWNKKSKHKDSYSKVDRYTSDHNERQDFKKGDFRDRRKQDTEENVRQKYYHKRNMVFYEEDSRKKFEELSSESDSDVRKGVISVVKTGQKDLTETIPSLLDINVSKPKVLKKESKKRKKSPKKERLIIQVGKSSDEEISRTKTRKKKVKKRKNWSSDEDEDEDKPTEQIVNVTFNKEVKPKKSTKSVYERLGMAVDKNSSSKLTVSEDTEFQRSREVTIPSGGKRIKLSSSGKYGAADKQKTDENIGGNEDAALNLRIQKIHEKNAEILKRKMEVEQDKQKYG